MEIWPSDGTGGVGVNRLSNRQLQILLWGALMAPGIELLPLVVVPVAERGAWLSTLLAWPALLAVGAGMLRLCPQGLAAGIRAGLGPVVGRGVLLLYLLWGEWLIALRLRLCAQRLLSAGERDGSLWFFLPLLGALVLWMVRGKVAAFARAAEVFWVALMVTAGAVLALSLPQVRGELLLPLWWGDGRSVLLGTVPVLGVMAYGVFIAFLLEEREQEKHSLPGWWKWGIGMGAFFLIEQIVVLGCFGPQLTMRLNSPFFALAKSVGVEGAFQRVESVIAAIWTFADFILIGVLALSLWKVAGQIKTGVSQQTAVTVALLPAVVIGMAAFSDGFAAEEAGRGITLLGNLVMGIGIPVVILWVVWLKRKLKKPEKRG